MTKGKKKLAQLDRAAAATIKHCMRNAESALMKGNTDTAIKYFCRAVNVADFADLMVANCILDYGLSLPSETYSQQMIPQFAQFSLLMCQVLASGKIVPEA